MLNIRTLVFLLAFVVAPFATAQTFPSKPIRLVVAFPPGGSTDIAARLLAKNLAESLKVPVIVDNKPGGNTLIGTDAVAKSAPDGYTLLLATSAFGIIPSLYAPLPFDVAKDFQPVAFVATFPSVLVVHPAMEARAVRDLIELARQKPGKLNFASAGSGSTGRLAGELLKQTAGIDIVHVPYKGGAPAFADLLAGHVQIMFANITEVMQPIRSGSLRGLAITGPKRTSLLPEVPTVAELGYPNLEVVNWQGILAPAGTPDEVVRLLNAEIRRAVASPEAKERLLTLGMDAVTDGTPKELAAHIASEMAKWGGVIRAGGIKAD